MTKKALSNRLFPRVVFVVAFVLVTAGNATVSESTEVDEAIVIVADTQVPHDIAVVDGSEIRSVSRFPIDTSIYLPMPLPMKPEGEKAGSLVGGQLISYNLVTGEETVSDSQDTIMPRVISERVTGSQGERRDLLEGASESVTEPLSFSPLYRVANPEIYPWRVNVKLYMTFASGYWVGSGVLIDPRNVLTAGHCVHDVLAGGTWASSIKVVPGYDDGVRPYGHASATLMSSWTEWVYDANWDHDMGIIRLDRPIGALTGWHGYAYNDNPSFYTSTSNTFYNPGYPAEAPFDGQHMYTWDGSFDYTESISGIWYGNEVGIDRRAYGGQSGSGAHYNHGGNRFVYAVLSNGNDTLTNFPRITLLKYLDINEWIAEDTPSTVDLRPLDVNVEPAIITAGNQLSSMDYLVHNYSSASWSGTVTVRVMLSSDDNISSAGDTLLQTHYFTRTFEPMSSVRLVVSTPPTIPCDIEHGNYWIGVVLQNPDDPVNNDSDGQDANIIHIDTGTCTTYYRDTDGDGYGVSEDTQCLCGPSTPYTATQGDDCDDGDWGVHPGATEVCNGKDDDCDGQTDPPDSSDCTMYYRDNDGDGYGVSEDSQCLCSPSSPYTATQGDDCDDSDSDVHPGATEICDGEDDDCDGQTDPPGSSGCTMYYRDNDGDDFGVDGDTQCLCSPSSPYTAIQGDDCDDGDSGVHPGATEVCDGEDDDCDGQIDPPGSFGCTIYYLDDDHDDFGVDGDTQCLCSPGRPYTAGQGGDCDDKDPDINPAAPEVCNGVDNDCDGTVDTGGDALCDNGLFCDGAETCAGFARCQPGTPPCAPPECCDEDMDQCEPAAIIRLEPVQVSGGCDTAQLAVAAVVENVTDLHSLKLSLTFDPSVIQVAACAEGSFLGQAGSTEFLPDIDNTLGRVTVTNALLGSDPGASGCGVVALLTLEVIDWDALPVDLCFDTLTLEDHLVDPICALSECGAVTNPRKGDVDASGYIDYVDLFDFVFEWSLTCEDEGYCSVKDYNDDCSIHYQDLFDFVFDWHTGTHLIKPDGGEICGGTEEIAWEAGPVTAEDLLVDLYLTTDGGACWNKIALDEVDDGSYTWDTTGWPDSDQCKLKIVGHNSTETYEDESDDLFTINNAGASAGGPSKVESEASVKPYGSTAKSLSIKTKVIRKTRRAARVEVLVEAKKVEGLHNISFDLEFDPGVVQVLDCEQGGFLKRAGETVFLPDIDNKKGKVNVASALLGRDAGASGSGTVARLTVVVKKPELLSIKLRLDNVVLQGSQGEAIQ